MEIELVDGSVRLDVSGTYSAEQLRELLAKLANAHGELTGIQAPDTKTPRWHGSDLDIRLIEDGVTQISLLTLFGWGQVRLTEQTAKAVLAQITTALGVVELPVARH